MIYILAGLMASVLMLRTSRKDPGVLMPSGASRLVPSRTNTAPRDIRADEDLTPATTGRFAQHISFLILFLVAALRHGVGTDYWARYVPIFERVRQGISVDYEQGFLLVNRLVAAFTDNHQWFFACMSLLTVALFYRFIVRMSLNPALSTYIYVFGGFYLEAFNLVRQGLAVAILVNTIELALRRRYLPFVALTLLAGTLHSSALLWLAVLPLLSTRFSRGARAGVALITMLTIALTPQVLGDLVQRLAPQYSWYFESNYGTVRDFDPAGVTIAVTVFVGLVVLMRRSVQAGRYTDIIMSLYGAYLVVLAATILVAYAFSRLTPYFAPIQIIAVPLLLAAIKDPGTRRLATVAVMVAYGAAFIYNFLVWNAHGVLPYESVLSR